MNLTGFLYVTLAIVIIFALSIVHLFIRRRMAEQKVRIAEEKARRILEDSKREAETKRREAQLEAKDESIKLRTEFERETRERKAELLNLEKRLLQREEKIDAKIKTSEEQENKLKTRESELVKAKENLENIRKEHVKELERVSGLSRDEAKRLLLVNIQKDIDRDIAVYIKKTEEQARKDAEKKAKEILTTAIQRCAVDHVVETTTTTVELPSDDMKGRKEHQGLRDPHGRRPDSR